MGHIFRINKAEGRQKTTIEDWSNSSRSTYDHGYIDKIQDSTTTQKEITSIPSPFARIELVKEAFGKIVPGSISNYSNPEEVKSLLHGRSIYHKMVSDSLDVAQIFFCYPSMKDKVEIKVWDKEQHIKELKDSDIEVHRTYGKTLEMFFNQDAMGADPYNFGKMKNIYILKYVGPGQRPMHIIGATSPATLFFSTANDESSISKHLCFGTDYAFDGEYASLDLRDPAFLKYLFALRYSDSDFSNNYPEVAKYLDAVYFVLDDKLKNELNDIQRQCSNVIVGTKSYLDANYDSLAIPVTTTSEMQVEVNGHFLYYKTINLQGNSDFEIKPTIVNGTGIKPLILPTNNSYSYENMEYYGCKFGRNFSVPYFDANPLNERSLPGLNIPYPYLTISDFLDDKIIQLPSEVNREEFFNGNYVGNSTVKDGYLLPIKPLYFKHFTINDLKGKVPSGKNALDIKSLASGIEVTLRIPIKGKEVEYKRIYTEDVKADKCNNSGAIVKAPDDFIVGVFPPVEFTDVNEAHYRIAILSDFSLNKECSCRCLDGDSLFTPDYVVRNADIENDIRSKVYYLDGSNFQGAYITVLTDQPGKEQQATGLMIPKFKKRSGSAILKFAIDLGTSNTHIEYTTGDEQMPKPFEFGTDQPQMSLICKPSDVIRNHLRGEFIPEAIGVSVETHFPMRTVLCIDKINAGINETKVGSYVAFGNASPAFMYNKKEVGTKYNNFITNLKWGRLDVENEERIRCYIESLFLMIRNKVIQEGGSISQTQVKWFYPISMSTNKLGLFERVWNESYHKYFNPTAEPISVTESIAPYSFFQKTMAGVTNIVTIDIGGGTTDIVVADTNDVKCITSIRFAADAIFGSSLTPVQNGSLNGIIKQFKNVFIKRLEGLEELQKMLRDKTQNDLGNSAEVASFLFSLSENEKVIEKYLQNRVNFNKELMNDSSQKIVFYIFFTAIIYHLANLMKAKMLPVPTNIAFSGNGSKVISVLSPKKESLERLTTIIFSLIYSTSCKEINLIINQKNPKEATCKGGLFLEKIPQSVSEVKSVLGGFDSSTLISNQKYSDISSSMYKDVGDEVKNFMDFITIKIPKVYVNRQTSLNDAFGISNESIKLAIDSFNKDLSAYIEKGIILKLDSKDVTPDDIIEESLFFYPIIGVINDLSEQIFKRNNG